MMTHGSFFRRSAPILPLGSVCETSVHKWKRSVSDVQPQLYSFSFNRSPLAVQLVVHRVSDGVELARWPLSGAYGQVIDDGGNLYINYSTSPTLPPTPGNKVVISQLDPETFQPGAPIDLAVAPAPYAIPNSSIAKMADGTYVLATDWFNTADSSQGRIIWYTANSLFGPYTRTGNPTSAHDFFDQCMVGTPKVFSVPNGAHPNRCYFLYSTGSSGTQPSIQPPYYLALGYTDDFLSFGVARDAQGYTAKWIYPDVPTSRDGVPVDGVNSSDGCQPIELGNGDVLLTYSAGNQSSWSAVYTAIYQGSLAQLIAEFGV